MNFSFKNYNPEKYGIKKFQEGGEMTPPEGGAPAPEQAPVGGEDPMQQLLAACQQALQSQDCNLAMQVCQVLMQMAGGGGEAPAEAQGEPVYRKGGILTRRIRN